MDPGIAGAAHTSAIRLAAHHHQRLLHDRDQRAVAGALGVHLAARDRQRAAGLDDEAFRDDPLAAAAPAGSA